MEKFVSLSLAEKFNLIRTKMKSANSEYKAASPQSCLRCINKGECTNHFRDEICEKVYFFEEA